MKQNKIWPILRDVIIVTVLTGLGGFILGFTSTDHSSRFYFYGIALSNSLFCIIGFTISGCLAAGNRWLHLAFVGAIVWAVSIFNVIFFGFPIVMWMASVIAVAIFALIGGGISLLFKQKALVEISTNGGDEKFYEEVARELQEKPMVPGLWTKAFAETGGDDSKARALYIKYRVAQLAEASQQNLEKEQIAKQQLERPKRVRKLKIIFAAVILVPFLLTIVFQIIAENDGFGRIGSLKILASEGDADAAYALGLKYKNGDANNGVAKDYGEAFKWFRKAAARSHADAQCYLGEFYNDGEGVAKDEVEAVNWWRKSADQGNAIAQCYLGASYQFGVGVQQDEVEAYKWYSIAAAQGVGMARENLTNIELNITPEQIAQAKKHSAAFVTHKDK